MSPKEKAIELVDKYLKLGVSANNIININRAKQYALIAVNFAIKYNDFALEYLYEVKQEIEKL